MKAIDVDIKSLIPYAKNPRNNNKAVDAVANSIKEFGFKVPLVIDKDNVIVCGHTRYKAALKLGLDKVPCIVASDLNEKEIKAFRLADNKVAELSSWNFELLESELIDLDMDMSCFGFEVTEDMTFDDLSDNQELDLNSFSDEQFEYVCPECGFMFNE